MTELVNKTNDITAWLEIGELHQGADKMDEARDAYEKILTFAPQFAQALNNLAYLYSEHYGDLEKASDMASRAREVRPNDPYVADTLGWILYKQAQYPRALTLLQESLEKQPASGEVQMHVGMVYYMMEDEDLARLHLQQALTSHDDFPGKAEARLCLDLLAIDPTNATPAQRQMLDSRLQNNPHDPVLLSRLAAIDELHGDTDKAADAYQKLITQDPQNWNAMLKLANLYSGPLHDTRKALDLAKSAHQVAPSDPHAAATLGELVYTSGDYPWAVSLLEDAAPQLPNQADVHYYLGMAYYAVGRLADADTAMNDVANPGASQPFVDQAKQFQAFRAAIKDPSHSPISSAQVKTVLDKDPHYLPALMLSALLSEQQQDFKQAGQTYEQILTEYPKFTLRCANWPCSTPGIPAMKPAPTNLPTKPGPITPTIWNWPARSAFSLTAKPNIRAQPNCCPTAPSNMPKMASLCITSAWITTNSSASRTASKPCRRLLPSTSLRPWPTTQKSPCRIEVGECLLSVARPNTFSPG